MAYKNKILIIGPLPPPMGGIATYVDDMLKSNIIDQYDVLHLNTTRSIIIKKSFPRNLILFLKNALKLIYVLLFERPKVVHIHTSSYFAFWEKSIFLIISKIFFTKVILHIHGGGFYRFYENSQLKNLIKFILNLSNKIITLSDFWRNLFNRFIDENKLSVIPNGVNYSLFNLDKIKDIESNGSECIYILYAGYLTKSKGIYDILNSIPIVIKKNTNVKFIFAGVEEKKGELENIKKVTDQERIDSYVFFAGQLTKPEMIYIYNKSDIFVLPSYIEGLPISILEAMAAGLPIISTPVGAIPEVIKEGENGLLMNTGNCMDLANKIIKLIENKELRLKIGKNNREKIREKYDWSIISKKICEEYEILLR